MLAQSKTNFHLPAKIFVVNPVLASIAKSTMSVFVKLPKDSYL